MLQGIHQNICEEMGRAIVRRRKHREPASMGLKPLDLMS